MTPMTADKSHLKCFNDVLIKLLSIHHPKFYMVAKHVLGLSSKEAAVHDKNRIKPLAAAEEVVYPRMDIYSLGRFVLINNDNVLYEAWLTIKTELSRFVINGLRLSDCAEKNDVSFGFITTYKEILPKFEGKN